MKHSPPARDLQASLVLSLHPTQIDSEKMPCLTLQAKLLLLKAACREGSWVDTMENDPLASKRSSYLERFSNDCRETKTKAITPTNHIRNEKRDEPITIPRNYL